MFLVGVCETRFPSNRSRTLWTSSPAVLPAPLRGDAARPAAAARATTRPRSTPTAPAPAPTTRRRSCGSATSPSPGPPTGSRSRRTSGARARRPSAPRPTSDVVRDQLEAWGEPVAELARQAGQGRPQPVRRRRPVPAVAGDRARAARPRCGSRPRERGARGRPDGGRRRPRHGRGGPGRRLGRRARPAGRRGPRPTAPTSIDVPAADAACRPPRSSRLRDDPEAFARELARPMPRPAVAGRPVRHPLPRLGRGAVRPAGPLRPRRPARPGRRRHRRRRRPRAS